MKTTKALLFLLLLIVLTSCNNRRKEQTIRLGYIPSASAAAIFYSLENDCLKKYRIEVAKYKSSDLLAVDLSKNQIQVSLVCGMAQLLKQSENIKNSLVIIGIYESTPCFLIPKGKSIEYLDSLAKQGKFIVGCWPGATFPHYTKTVLDSLGIKSDNLYITPSSPGLQISQLEKGEINALFTLEPNGVKATVDNIADYVYKDKNLLAEYIIKGEYFPGGGLAVSKKIFDEMPELVEDLINCLKISKENLSPTNTITVQALAKYVSLRPDYTASMKIELPKIGKEMDSKEMEALIESLIEMKQLEKNFNWREVFYFE